MSIQMSKMASDLHDQNCLDSTVWGGEFCKEFTGPDARIVSNWFFYALLTGYAVGFADGREPSRRDLRP